MAWASGTATDFIDFLRKLRDYANGTIDPSVHPTITAGVQVPLADRWTVETNGGGQPNIPGSGFATDGEVYLTGPGSDTADEIVVGIRTYRNAGNNIFGLEICGYTAFDDTLTFDTMPGKSPAARVALDDASMSCWFWVNSRRVMALARVGTSDILLHFGFIQQFGTRSQYPYPLLVAGSVSDATKNFQVNDYSHSCLPDPCETAAYLRWVDGTWQQHRNFVGSTASRATARVTTGNVVWPQRNPVTSADGANNGSASGNEDALFETYNSSTTPVVSNTEIDVVPMFPTVLMNATALIGRIDGLMTIFGLGLTSGDTLTDNTVSPPVVYDVFFNTWRNEPVDCFAIRRE